MAIPITNEEAKRSGNMQPRAQQRNP